MSHKKYNHIHRYERRNLGRGYIVYACNLPGCTHYLSEALVLNKIGICNKCNDEFVITRQTLTRVMTHCESNACYDRSPEKDEQTSKLKDILAEKGIM